ncbi:MAG TPA: response regulator [Alphaproteobacteria bacterium]|nr:response regulator [Alphaproteobacteria bacterium]
MTNTPHILVVEDDRETRDLVARYLSGRGFRVTTTKNGAEMRQALETSNFSLVLLDLMLPGEDGLSLCRRLRAEKSSMPIIMLTALGEEADRIVGLESGADDYLPKPFSPRELVARITAVLRRADPAAAPAEETRLAFAGFILEQDRRRLIGPEGTEITLTAGEYDLLVALARRPRRVLNRDQLLDLTKGREASPFDRSVDVQVSRLRRKLQHAPDAPEIIKTVRFGGYVFAAEVTSC